MERGCADEPPQETFLESHHKVTSNTLAISSASVQSESKQGKDLFNYAIVKKVRWCLNIKERSAHLHFILADHYDGFKADLVLFNAMTEAQFHACKELNPLVEGFVTSSGTSLELSRCGSIIRVWSHDLGRFAQVPFIADAKMTIQDLVQWLLSEDGDIVNSSTIGSPNVDHSASIQIDTDFIVECRSLKLVGIELRVLVVPRVERFIDSKVYSIDCEQQNRNYHSGWWICPPFRWPADLVCFQGTDSVDEKPLPLLNCVP